MKKYLLSIMMAVVALSSCADNKKQESGDRSQENTPATDISTDSSLQATDSSSDLATDFTLNDLSGKPLTLSSLRGKYVILDFWIVVRLVHQGLPTDEGVLSEVRRQVRDSRHRLQ